MNNLYLCALSIISLGLSQSCKLDTVVKPVEPSPTTLDVSLLQFNTWGGKAADAIVNEISVYEPDFVTLSEAGGDITQKITESLAKKGLTYYRSNVTTSPGVISRYPITYHSKSLDYRAAFNDDGHGLSKIVVNVQGHEIAVYSAHLDYTHYACYLPRGYDGMTWNKLPAPVTDVNKIMAMNNGSTRLSNMQNFIDSAKADAAKGRSVLLGGDFNEPSYLDWTEATKNLFDHNGVVVPWPVTKKLKDNGFVDSYREKYPNEVEYPGFTWVVQGTWTPEADERDRIDYIYYYAKDNISLASSAIIGPKEMIVKNQTITEMTKDNILLPQGSWKSDHRAVLCKFKIQLPVKK